MDKTDAEEIETVNDHMVGVRGDGRIVVTLPPLAPMGQAEALRLAAWLVAVADPGLERWPGGARRGDRHMTGLEPLWAVHVAGPDDVLAMASREAAETFAAGVNEVARRLSARPDADPDLDPHLSARVVEWDGTAADHAAALAGLDSEGYWP